MERFVLDSLQLQAILEKTIDLFQEYQYKHGYDEPRARAEAIMEIIGALSEIGGEMPQEE